MSPIEPRHLLKICGITCTEDARAAIEAGANALGFNFYPKSPRYVTRELAHTIVASTPGSYLKVGVFVHPTREDLLTAAEEVPLDVVQVHGEHSTLPGELPFRLWKALPGETAEVSENDHAEAYLLDAHTPEYGGSGQTFRWELAQNFKQRTIVAGGLDASNVAAAIGALHPWGVDACSRLESRPGKKDIPHMRAFLEAAQKAFSEQNTLSLKTVSL